MSRETIVKTINEYIDLITKEAILPLHNNQKNLQELNEDYASLVEGTLSSLVDLLPSDIKGENIVKLLSALYAIQHDINATNDEELLKEFVPQIDPCDLERE